MFLLKFQVLRQLAGACWAWWHVELSSLLQWDPIAARDRNNVNHVFTEIQVVRQLAGGLGVLACGPSFPALACGITGSEACPTHPVWRDSAFTKVLALPVNKQQQQ
jgi:hypothetical protein